MICLSCSCLSLIIVLGSYCLIAIGESFGQVYSPIYPLLLVRFLLGSGINGNLLEEALEGDEYKEKAKYLEILRVQADEIERANQEMDKQLDKEFADQIASGKAAAAKEIAKMNAYDDHMRAFREALAKGKSKKD